MEIPGGSPAVPDIITDTLPPVLFTVKVALKLPFAVGANVTGTMMEAPDASVVPTAGRPLTAKGDAGNVKLFQVRA